MSGIELPHHKYSFLGTLTFNRDFDGLWKPTITCTVSLIAPIWVISAAHCLGKKSKLNRRACIDGASCSTNSKGDFIYKPGNIKSHIRLGITDFYEQLADAQTFEIEEIIRPREAYPSGGYGDYGGIDVILIKLKKPVNVNVNVPICLPTMDYRDTSVKAIIAGYGKYRRPTCLVGPRGPTKFRYCGIDQECRKMGDKYKNASCQVTFPYNGKVLKGCQKAIPSPSSKQAECRKFFKQRHLRFRSDIDEFEIYDKETLALIAKCYRKMDKLGWCGTYMNDDVTKPEFSIRADSGWGFCSQECFQDEEEPFFGKAREKLVDVLDDAHCESELTRNGTRFFVHQPQVLCVGLNHSYNIRVYLKDAKNRYHHVPQKDKRYEKLVSVEKMWYIIGPGSCHGDSGGPAFQPALSAEGRPIFVLLGLTSSGTSNIGHCGGINNPTHYTRLKKIAGWISEYVKEKELCWAGAETHPAPL